MEQIPINEEKISTYNKKAMRILLVLTLCGVLTGLILSVIFVNEANDRIANFDEFFDMTPPDSSIFPSPEPLTISESIVPAFGVIIVCISLYLLIGLVVIYFKIFLKTNSKYIVGLLFFLTPLLIQSIFSINTLRSLFVSSAIPYRHIRESIGFEIGGFGSILVILSLFEIVGLSMLVYLSAE